MTASGGGELAVRVEGLGAAAPPATALAAVARIQAWHGALTELARIADAQIMEACWVIRREHPDRADFGAFVAAHLDVLDAERAWLMADTWDVARRQRSLRALAADRPADAIAFVREFVSAGCEERLEGLGEDDRRVAEILSSPPRRRTAQIRELIASHQQRLRLEPPEPPEPPELPEPPEPPEPPRGWEAFLTELRAAVMRLDELAGRISDPLSEGTARPPGGRILSLTDLGTGALDSIASAAAEAMEEQPR